MSEVGLFNDPLHSWVTGPGSSVASQPVAIRLILLLATLVFAGGCDFLGNKEQTPTVETGKRDRPPKRRDPKPQEPVKPAEAPPTVSLEFDFDPTAKARTCYARLIELQPGGPVILKITSYDDPAQESFPSFLLSAKVSGNKPEALVGQSVPAIFFARLQPNGPDYVNVGADGVQLEITKQQSGELQGAVRGKLRVGGTQEVVDVAGGFTAELLGGAP